MADYDNIVRERQKDIRREIDRRRKLIKTIAVDGGWENPSSVLSWFPAHPDSQPNVMSVANLFRLLDTRALPVDLLSMLLPAGQIIVQVPEQLDHDDVAKAMIDFLAAKEAAHHPDSPAGRDIADCEDNVLRGKFARVKAA